LRSWWSQMPPSSSCRSRRVSTWIPPWPCRRRRPQQPYSSSRTSCRCPAQTSPAAAGGCCCHRHSRCSSCDSAADGARHLPDGHHHRQHRRHGAHSPTAGPCAVPCGQRARRPVLLPGRADDSTRWPQSRQWPAAGRPEWASPTAGRRVRPWHRSPCRPLGRHRCPPGPWAACRPCTSAVAGRSGQGRRPAAFVAAERTSCLPSPGASRGGASTH